MTRLAPICFLAHQRAGHAAQALDALAAADLASQSEIHIFIDPAPSEQARDAVDQVIAVCDAPRAFGRSHVHVFPRNLGLGVALLAAIDEMFARHDRVIVVEDDIIVAPTALVYFNAALAHFEKDTKTMAACAYIFGDMREAMGSDSFFSRRGGCWGWATWRDRWTLLDRDSARVCARIEAAGLADFFRVGNASPMLDKLRHGDHSWSPLWYAAAALHARMFLYPSVPLARNIGFDGSGAHAVETDAYDVSFVENAIVALPAVATEHPGAEELFQREFARAWARRQNSGGA